jgi:hypothetical protein
MQHAERMRHIILSPVTYLTVQYFSTLSPKGHDFRENFIEDKMCVLMFSTAFVGKTFYSKNNSERNYHNSTGFHVKYALFFVDIKLEFFGTYLRKIIKYQISQKSVVC